MTIQLSNCCKAPIDLNPQLARPECYTCIECGRVIGSPMPTKNIQDVVAEILLLAQKGVRKVKDDDMTFEQFNEALRHHLTQLVKEVEAGGAG